MNWTVNILALLILTTFTGSLFTILWWICSRLIRRISTPRFVYFLLRGAMLGYFVPVMYLWMKFQEMFFHRGSSYLVKSYPFSTESLRYVFAVWCAGMLIALIKYVYDVLCLRSVCRFRFLPPVAMQLQLRATCRRLKIHRSIRLYQGYRIMVPFINGILRPAICLPDGEYDVQSLEMILTHELYHYKQGDVFWKPVFGIVKSVYWFNPLAWYTYKQMSLWAEASCDMRCQCDQWTRKEYMQLLLAMLQDVGSAVHHSMPTWFEDSDELIWRMNCMKQYQKTKMKHAVVALVLTLSMMSGLFSVYAVENTVLQAGQSLYWNMNDNDLGDLDDTDDLVEYTGSIDDFEGLRISQDMSSPASTQNIVVAVDWTVSKYAMKTSGVFAKSTGSTVNVMIQVRPTDKYVNVGIICPNGSTKYVHGKGYISHEFTCPTGGTYEFFVANLNSRTITAQGSYAR